MLWTEKEIDTLRENIYLSEKSLADLLNRTIGSINNKKKILGLIKPILSNKERFWSKVNKNSGKFGDDGTYPTECYEWVAMYNKGSYGVLRVNRKSILAHRFAWGLENGPIPEGMCVLHKCDNPKCVRLDHLFLGTLIDNNQDRNNKGRSAKGENNFSAKLSKEAVLEIRRLYFEEEYLQYELAYIFKVDKSNISNILNNKLWR